MEYSANVHEIEHEGKRIVLVGTAHISRESVEEVSRVIEQEQPDVVCIELCAARYEALQIDFFSSGPVASVERAEGCTPKCHLSKSLKQI